MQQQVWELACPLNKTAMSVLLQRGKAFQYEDQWETQTGISTSNILNNTCIAQWGTPTLDLFKPCLFAALSCLKVAYMDKGVT